MRSALAPHIQRWALLCATAATLLLGAAVYAAAPAWADNDIREWSIDSNGYRAGEGRFQAYNVNCPNNYGGGGESLHIEDYHYGDEESTIGTWVGVYIKRDGVWDFQGSMSHATRGTGSWCLDMTEGTNVGIKVCERRWSDGYLWQASCRWESGGIA